MPARRVLLGVSGGIAAYKSVVLLRLMKAEGWEVQVVMTPMATQFVGPLTFSVLADGCHTDVVAGDGRWDNHVLLAEWAEVMVVAPATAHLVGRMVHGLADNMLLLSYLSFEGPVFVAPAMDRGMYRHPAVVANLQALAQRPRHTVWPVGEGALASGLTGAGRMLEPADIMARLKAAGIGA